MFLQKYKNINLCALYYPTVLFIFTEKKYSLKISITWCDLFLRKGTVVKLQIDYLANWAADCHCYYVSCYDNLFFITLLWWWTCSLNFYLNTVKINHITNIISEWSNKGKSKCRRYHGAVADEGLCADAAASFMTGDAAGSAARHLPSHFRRLLSETVHSPPHWHRTVHLIDTDLQASWLAMLLAVLPDTCRRTSDACCLKQSTVHLIDTDQWHRRSIFWTSCSTRKYLGTAYAFASKKNY